MSEKEKKSAPRENLTWKINYLAAQVGETTHMKTAIIAASRAKYHQIHSGESLHLDTDALKQELYNARKLKLETKLHQARKETKAALKKGKSEETKKQIKKIKSSRKLLEDSSEEKEDEKKPKKKITAADIEQYEKELEILKEIDLDTLVEKTIKNKLQKNATLKNEELIKELIETHIEPIEKTDQITQNIESRLISQKAVVTEVGNIISSFQSILLGNNEKIEKRKAEEFKKKKVEEEKKRKAEEAEKSQNKKPKLIKKKKDAEAGTSEFMETLGDVSDDENEDENFKKIYEGEKKPNRQGQRQRRKQWEEMYGREANHVAAEYNKREEKRLANPDYKPKKKPTPKPNAANNNSRAAAAPAEPVHPSWEAKRMQEEIMSKALSGKGTSNNKIVFDDSD